MKRSLITAALLAISTFSHADVIYNFTSFQNDNQFIDRGASVVDLQTGIEWLDIGLTFGVSACEYEASFVDAPVNQPYTCVNGEDNSVLLSESLRNLILEDWRLTDFDAAHTFLSNLHNVTLPTRNSVTSGLTQEGIQEVSDLFLGEVRTDYGASFIYGTSNTFLAPGRLKALGVEYYPPTDSGFTDVVSVGALAGPINTGLFLSRQYDSNRAVLEGNGVARTMTDELIISQQFISPTSVNAPSSIAIMLLGVAGLLTRRLNRA